MSNEITFVQNDEIPESLKKFEKAWDSSMKSRLPSSSHNLYLLQTVDMEGNITGEAYGVNLMTNKGFQSAYYDDNIYYRSCVIFIGEGTDVPTLDNYSLYKYITQQGTTNDTNSHSRSIYGALYDKETGIISIREKVYSGYFDYNISGIEEDKEITEIGFGTAYNKLMTHSQIYVINEETGETETGSITKRLNERLYITAYFSIQYHKNVIESLYTQGFFCALRPNLFLNTVYGEDGLYTYYLQNNDEIYARYGDGSTTIFRSGYGGTTLDFDNNEIYSEFTIGSKMLEDPRHYVSNILLSAPSNAELCNLNGSAFLLFSKIKREEPEEIVCENVHTNGYSSSYLTNIFGNYNEYPDRNIAGLIPVVDIDIQSLQMWDHTIKDWGINELFVNNPDCDYNTKFFGCVSQWIRIPFLNTSRTVYIYINLRPDIPILSFSNSGMSIYATDEYWNVDDWTLISNLSDIDEPLRNKRYYITFEIPGSNDGHTLNGTRDQVKHMINTREQKRSYSTTLSRNVGALDADIKPLSSDEYGYVMTHSSLWYPDSVNDEGKPYTYELQAYGYKTGYIRNYHRWVIGEGDKIVVSGNENYFGTHIRIYNISKDPTVSPTYENVEYEFSVAHNSSHHLYITASKNGFITAQRLDGEVDEAIVINVYGGEDGNTATQHRIDNVKCCHTLDLSDNCVYLTTTSDIPTFEIYDMRNQTVIDTFSLPDSTYTVSAISGWKDYIYIRVSVASTYSTFLYNMNTKMLSHLTAFDSPIISCTTSSYYTHQIACVDECMVLFNTTEEHPTYIMTAEDPENPIRMLSTSVSTDFEHICGGQLKYMNDGRSLIFSANTYRRYAVDIGHIIDTKTPLQNLYYYHYYYYKYAANYCLGLYKDSVFLSVNEGYSNIENVAFYPIENFIEHKMVGTTYTINSYNNPVKIGSRKYKIRMTNNTSKYE